MYIDHVTFRLDGRLCCNSAGGTFVAQWGVLTDLKIRLDSAYYCFRPMVFEARDFYSAPY